MAEASTSSSVYPKLHRIAMQAKDAPQMVFTNLAHLVDLDFLREAYRLTRKDGAPGVDGTTAADYAQDLEGNLENLLDRMKSGLYRAPAVRRVHIPKDDKGNTRPLGIPTFEDKVLQRAITMVLESIYEQDFLDCSYGYRPKRSAHQALEAIRGKLQDNRGGWVLEVDIKGFFDALDHKHLRDILDLRVRDRGIRRIIHKWLKAGVLEGLSLSRPSSGTPQGGVISPLLANIYLHEVLDLWFERQVKPVLDGPAELIRYADDFVIIFRSHRDAVRVWNVLPKRMGKYGLTLHEHKTRLVDFRKPHKDFRPETFDFLGLTHYSGKNKSGAWVVLRKTSATRFKRGLRGIADYCADNRHKPVQEQHRGLCLRVLGHFRYFGLAGNCRALNNFLHQVGRLWRKWLSRRSQKSYVTWEKMLLLLKRYPLPKVRVFHRFGAANL
jgi:RNA-directed DNA polymerase